MNYSQNHLHQRLQFYNDLVQSLYLLHSHSSLGNCIDFLSKLNYPFLTCLINQLLVSVTIIQLQMFRWCFDIFYIDDEDVVPSEKDSRKRLLKHHDDEIVQVDLTSVLKAYKPQSKVC